MTRLGIHRIELLLVVPLLVVAVVGSFGAAEGQDARRGIDALAVVLLVAGPLLLLLWRRWPVVTLGGVVAVTAVYFGFDYPYGPVFFSLVLALIAGVVSGHRRLAWALAAAMLAVVLTVRATAGIGQDVTFGDVAAGLTWIVIALVLGEVVKLRLERRAVRAAVREDEIARRAQEERLRIARELHDVLGAQHLADQRPGRRGAARHGRAARAGAHVAHRDPRGQPRRAAGGPRGARHAARRGRGARRARRRRPSTTSRSWRRARPRAGCVSTTEVTGARRPLPPAWTAPRTGSCRRRSPTCTATPAPARRRVQRGLRRLAHGRRSTTTAAAARPDPDGGGSGIAACASARRAAGRALEAGPRRRGRVPRARRAAAGGTPRDPVLLADDQALVRAGFRVLLESQDDIEVVGEAGRRPRGGATWRAATAPTWC